ncbi:MAG: Hsp20/alpha crystallin family protein [Candidatus Hodarchaeales archaeon]|jgi:HSP20 family protein
MNRKRRLFDDFWNFDLTDIFRSFSEEFNTSMNDINKEYNEGGPITFGYSMRIGPDTAYKPEVRQWGNLNDYREKQGLPHVELFSKHSESPQIASESTNPDRFVDILDETDSLKILVEVPGFTKESLNMEISESGLELSLNGKAGTREINQVIHLPSKIEPKQTKSSIRNGVLEIRSKKQKTTEKKHKLNIE